MWCNIYTHLSSTLWFICLPLFLHQVFQPSDTISYCNVPRFHLSIPEKAHLDRIYCRHHTQNSILFWHMSIRFGPVLVHLIQRKKFSCTKPPTTHVHTIELRTILYTLRISLWPFFPVFSFHLCRFICIIESKLYMNSDVRLGSILCVAVPNWGPTRIVFTLFPSLTSQIVFLSLNYWLVVSNLADARLLSIIWSNPFYTKLNHFGIVLLSLLYSRGDSNTCNDCSLWIFGVSSSNHAEKLYDL